MADQGFQASKSQQLDNEATEANVFLTQITEKDLLNQFKT
jgi:hypothetical protein